MLSALDPCCMCPHTYQVTVGKFVFWGVFKISPTHLATVSHIDDDVSFLIKNPVFDGS